MLSAYDEAAAYDYKARVEDVYHTGYAPAEQGTDFTYAFYGEDIAVLYGGEYVRQLDVAGFLVELGK